MILQNYCSKLSENIRGGELALLPLVNKETIKNIIIKYDELFTKSVVKSQNFEEFIDKIKLVVMQMLYLLVLMVR